MFYANENVSGMLSEKRGRQACATHRHVRGIINEGEEESLLCRRGRGELGNALNFVRAIAAHLVGNETFLSSSSRLHKGKFSFHMATHIIVRYLRPGTGESSRCQLHVVLRDRRRCRS